MVYYEMIELYLVPFLEIWSAKLVVEVRIIVLSRDQYHFPQDMNMQAKCHQVSYLLVIYPNSCLPNTLYKKLTLFP